MGFDRLFSHLSRAMGLPVIAGLILALAWPLAWGGLSGEPPSPAGAQNAYILGPGDRVRVTVFGEPDLSGEFQVDGQGTFPMGLIGVVRAADLSSRALETKIATAYADGFLVNPQISVEVLNFRPFFILGEVRNPGSFPYREGMTVIGAVALAGGFTFRADEDDIEITRGGDTSRDPEEATLDTLIQPGDMIRVTERLF